MNLYNIIISSLLNSFLLILVEGIIFLTLVYTIFSNIFLDIIGTVTKQINLFINKTYYVFLPNINNNADINVLKESPSFQSSAIKLYSLGTMYNEIITENKAINLNKLKSYAIFTSIVLGFIILIGIVLYVNEKTYSIKTNTNALFYNVIISFILFVIFIIAISFVVFINMENNIDTNSVQVKFIKIVQQLFT